MADFCSQCSLTIFGEDYGDLAKLMPLEKYSDGIGAGVVCEECGATVVDYEGRCIASWCKQHRRTQPTEEHE